ncbi:MAG TPA: ABC transporter ATP-binding protein [Bacteroidales bacterium]|nr:ABC transporter ATP-binding protein [Bacteroidales bacterium]HSA42161.1 ABC transporter ATP-binding protein [Bacteroidales bacterium]
MEKKTEDYLLNVENLHVSFFTNQMWIKAVDGISFCLKRGKVTGVVGESGSGKSVTALTLMGLLPESGARTEAGSILFKPGETNLDILHMKPEEKKHYRGRHMSMIFQEPMTSLNPVMRCGKQVMEVLQQHEGLSPKAAADRTIRLFEEVRLPRVHDIFKSWPHQLSGGQKQRVMIAMAIACRPALLIADEPTTALDVTVQKAVLELLRELQQQYNMSVLFITHDLAVVRHIADDILVMYHGKIVESGSCDTVFREASHPYTRGLLACRPGMGIRPGRLPGVGDFTEGTEASALPPESAEERQTRLETIYRQAPLMKLEDVSVSFPLKKNWLGHTLQTLQAVDSVSISVFPGETLGLVGESGCGKTTLGRAMLALIAPGGGKITAAGQQLDKSGKKQLRSLRKQFQIIFQDPYSSLNPRISIGACLTEPLLVHKVVRHAKQARERAHELLEKVGLTHEHYYRYPHEFSGGQRQRICIARALSLQPRFIICDESVSALDISIQAQILNLLNDLKEAFGFTYVFISHDLSVVRYMSDRIVVMKDGRIVESGDADQICANPASAYTRSLVEAIL